MIVLYTLIATMFVLGIGWAIFFWALKQQDGFYS